MVTKLTPVSSTPDLEVAGVARHPDETIRGRIELALERLEQEQVLHGAAAKRLSVRVDPGLLAAAQARTGLDTPSEIVTAALALLAADDGYGAWLVARRGRLSQDFELPL